MIDLTEEPLVKAADVQNKRSLSICNYKYKKLLANNVRHDSYFHTRELAKSDQKVPLFYAQSISTRVRLYL